MKRFAITVVILAAILAACPLWAVENPAPTTGQSFDRRTPSPSREAPEWLSRDGMENATRELPAIKSRIDTLERAVKSARKRGNAGAVTRLQRQLLEANLALTRLKRRMTNAETNPLGAEKGQRAMWGILHDAGVISGSNVSAKIVAAQKAATSSTTPATPAGRGNGMDAFSIALLSILGVVAIGALAYGIYRQRRAAPAVRTLADPAAYGTETAAHRAEIGAVDAPPAGGESIVEGWRYSGPSGTFSGERWTNRGTVRLVAEAPQERQASTPLVEVKVNNYGVGSTDAGTTEDRARCRPSKQT